MHGDGFVGRLGGVKAAARGVSADAHGPGEGADAVAHADSPPREARDREPALTAQHRTQRDSVRV